MFRATLASFLSVSVMAIAAPISAAQGGSPQAGNPSLSGQYIQLSYVESWPQLGRTSARTSASTLVRPAKVSGHTTTQLAGGCHSSPVIGRDGTVYVSCDTGIYAFDRQLKQKWVYDTFWSTGNSAPAIADDVIIVCDSFGEIFAIEDNGLNCTVRWSLGLSPAVILGSPAVEWSELTQEWVVYLCTAYAGSSTLNSLYSLSAWNGAIRWAYDVPPGSELEYSTPSVQRVDDPAGIVGNRIFFGDTTSAGFALQETAAAPGYQLDWIVSWNNCSFGCDSTKAPVIDEAAGLVYFSVVESGLNWDGFLYAVAIDTGLIAAQLQITGNGISDTHLTAPALGPDGTLYFGTNTGFLHAVGTPTNGAFPAPKWKTKLNGPIRNSAAFVDGAVAVGTEVAPGSGPGRFYVVDATTGVIIGSSLHGGASVSSFGFSNTWLNPVAQAFAVSNNGPNTILHKYE